jgi:hypothetical protein
VREQQSRLRPIGSGDAYLPPHPPKASPPGQRDLRRLATAAGPGSGGPGAGPARDLPGHQPGPGPATGR